MSILSASKQLQVSPSVRRLKTSLHTAATIAADTSVHIEIHCHISVKMSDTEPLAAKALAAEPEAAPPAPDEPVEEQAQPEEPASSSSAPREPEPAAEPSAEPDAEPLHAEEPAEAQVSARVAPERDDLLFTNRQVSSDCLVTDTRINS
eukprot:scaffold399559_cov33-Prasinocladus_malaysianus.AAC.1